MTVPTERAQAILTMKRIAEEFCVLLHKANTPCKEFKELAAASCKALRHYPNNFDVKELARYAPDSIAVDGVIPQSYLDEATTRDAERYRLLRNSLSSPEKKFAGRSHTQMPRISVPFHENEQTYTQKGLDDTLDRLMGLMKK